MHISPKKSRLAALAVFAAAVFLFPGTASAVHVAEYVRGRIVIDVDRNGEAWYVLPTNAQRVFLGRPEDAFRVMREQGVGIADAELAKVPPEGSSDEGDAGLRDRLAGRILLQVEANGEAWYVNPEDRKRYYLGRPEDAFRVMRQLGLGITHDHLAHLGIAGEAGSSAVMDVPFVAQAPYGDWKDLRQEEGCEETSTLMAVRWAEGRGVTRDEALADILAMADQQTRRFGYFHDTSAADTVERLFKDYFGFRGTELRYDVGTDDLAASLAAGKLIVLPVNGLKLDNPNFSPPGPRRHMIVIAGYDAATDEFISHDPGTRRGAGYRYSRSVLDAAMEDYVSGVYAPIDEHRTAMIAVEKN
jgi:hypothetical protein